MNTTAKTIRAARMISTPLVAIETADQWATLTSLAAALQEVKPGRTKPPMVCWDCARAFLPMNKPEGAAAIAAMNGDAEPIPGQVPGLNLVEALNMAGQLPDDALLFVMNAHLFWSEPGIVQGVMNLRELFIQNGRTLVMLCPMARLPLELQQDVLVINEPLPTEERIAAIVNDEVERAREIYKDLVVPDDETKRHAVEALAGLSEFPVSQTVAMSLAGSRCLDLDAMWARKRGFVEQTPGLKFDAGAETFADLGGLFEAKEHATRTFQGNQPPRAVLRIDEIEKAIAGASGPFADSSGTSQDALNVILRTMEDEGWVGMIEVGPPGSGKSAFSKTMGRTFGVPSLEMDLGAMKGSFVGQSEQNIRSAMRVIRAIAGADCYVVATCNRLDSIPSELRRRFTDSIWFFDLPTEDERFPIWTVNLMRFGLQGEDVAALVKLSAGWTGAEIRNACRSAYRTRRTVEEAALRIVPVSRADPDGIEKLRKLAAGRFLSATHPGTYTHPNDEATPPGAAAKRRFMEN